MKLSDNHLSGLQNTTSTGKEDTDSVNQGLRTTLNTVLHRASEFVAHVKLQRSTIIMKISSVASVTVLLLLQLNFNSATADAETSYPADLTATLQSGGRRVTIHGYQGNQVHRPESECTGANTASTRAVCRTWYSLGHPQIIPFTINNQLRYVHINQLGISIDIQLLDDAQQAALADAASRKYGETVNRSQIQLARFTELNCSLQVDADTVVSSTVSEADLLAIPTRVEFRSTQLRNWFKNRSGISLETESTQMELDCRATLPPVRQSQTLQLNASEFQKLATWPVVYLTQRQMSIWLSHQYTLLRQKTPIVNRTQFIDSAQLSLQSAGILSRFTQRNNLREIHSRLSFLELTLVLPSRAAGRVPMDILDDLNDLFVAQLSDEGNWLLSLSYVKYQDLMHSHKITELQVDNQTLVMYRNVANIGRLSALTGRFELERLNSQPTDFQWYLTNHGSVRVASLRCAVLNVTSLTRNASVDLNLSRNTEPRVVTFSPKFAHLPSDVPQNVSSSLLTGLSKIENRINNMTSLFTASAGVLTEVRETVGTNLLKDAFFHHGSDVCRSTPITNSNKKCAEQCLLRSDCKGLCTSPSSSSQCFFISDTVNSSCASNSCHLIKVLSEHNWRQLWQEENEKLQAKLQSVDNTLKFMATQSNSNSTSEVLYAVPCARLGGSQSCYFFSTDKADWESAEQACRRLRMHLVTIDSASEQAALVSYVSHCAAPRWWIGLKSASADGQNLSWSSGQAAYQYSLVSTGASATVPTGTCFAMEKSAGFSWTMNRCEDQQLYLCEATAISRTARDGA